MDHEPAVIEPDLEIVSTIQQGRINKDGHGEIHEPGYNLTQGVDTEDGHSGWGHNGDGVDGGVDIHNPANRTSHTNNHTIGGDNDRDDGTDNGIYHHQENMTDTDNLNSEHNTVITQNDVLNSTVIIPGDSNSMVIPGRTETSDGRENDIVRGGATQQKLSHVTVFILCIGIIANDIVHG